MASFQDALPVVLAHEIDPQRGGFVDNPNDKGGPTNDGITLSTLQRWQPGATVADLRAMTPATRDAIYRAFYWDPLGLDGVASQEVATKALDVSVNTGPWRGTCIVQEALVDLGHPLRVDGVWGPVTMAAVNAASPAALVNKIAEAQMRFYRAIVAYDRTQAVFLPAWTARAQWGVTRAAA